LAVRGEAESLRRNIAAIALLKKLESEARNATPQEKQKLAQRVGLHLARHGMLRGRGFQCALFQCALACPRGGFDF